jgi:hypothetical protein
MNENMLRGCLQEAQTASVLLTQAIAGIGTCALPRTLEEAQVSRLLRDARAIQLRLLAIELTGQDELTRQEVESWLTI